MIEGLLITWGVIGGLIFVVAAFHRLMAASEGDDSPREILLTYKAMLAGLFLPVALPLLTVYAIWWMIKDAKAQRRVLRDARILELESELRELKR